MEKSNLVTNLNFFRIFVVTTLVGTTVTTILNLSDVEKYFLVNIQAFDETVTTFQTADLALNQKVKTGVKMRVRIEVKRVIVDVDRVKSGINGVKFALKG